MNMFGVDNRDDAVQLIRALDALVDEKTLHHGRRVGEAGGFDHERVELIAMLQELKQAAQQIAAHSAADASVAQFDDFLIGGDQQMVIDANFAEFIDDDGNPATMISGKDSIEQSGLSGAEKAGKYGHGSSRVIVLCHCTNIFMRCSSRNNNAVELSQP